MLILLLTSLFSCAPSDTKYNVYNTEPGASISAPVDGQAFEERASVSFQGRVVDNQDDPSELYITWSSDLDGVLQEGRLADGDGNVSFVTANLSVGTHAITLTATDTSSARGFTSVGLVVEDVEDRPRVNILDPVGADYGVEDLPYTLRAGVTDDQDAASALLLTVTSDLEGELCRETPGADNIAVCDVILGAGSHLLTFTAWDSGGNSAEATTYFSVISESEHDLDGDGFTESLGDCDDTDDDRYPGASQVYDGVDQDCDNLVDEGTVGFDDDGDTYSELDGDCDDDDKTVYPTAKEFCDGSDNDCDLSIDEGTSCFDDDGDGLTEDDGDCDDTDSGAYPGAAEIYDGADNDCDYIVDEGTFGFDDDGDLYTEADGDCDDADRAVYPTAKESCDGVDNDCDLSIDEGTSCFDDDGDGLTEDDGDCNDANSAVYPGATEIYDGADNDCDYIVDEGTVGYDDDGDGLTELDGDCDDSNRSVYPSAKEICDSVDNDCDVTIDEGTSCFDDDGDGVTEDGGDCNDANSTIYRGATETYDGADNDCDYIIDEGTVGYDDDGDGVTEVGGDCNDANRSVYPGATESCDGVDNDCDVTIDEGTTCYDDDGDGYTEATGDCNDASSTISPKATESCDSVDNNCDGSTDPAGSAGCTTYYLDSDGDGYGLSTSSSCLCAPTTTYKVTNSSDCYDSNSKASPAQTGYFTANRGDGSYDYDCDGVEDQRYTTMGSCPTNILRCSADTVVGWKGSTPPKCGASRNMITRCAYDPTASLTTCTETTASTTQECQ